jgi:hypothetical protein
LRAADGYQHRLGNVVLVQEADDLLAGLVTIHEWHLMVHKYKLEVTRLELVLFYISNN